MNKNYYSNGIMRRVRQFTYDVTANAHSKDKDIERLRKLKKDDEITQTVYDREVSAIQESIKAQTVKIKESCRKDLMGTLEEMRRVAGNQIIKPPTQEMVSTLQLLGMLDSISPTQFTLYAEQMADCPLAMQRLQQIAKAHEQRIVLDDPDTKMKAVDELEGQLAYFLGNFDGDTSHSPATVLNMLPYFQPDEQYMGNPNRPLDTDKADKLFWSEFVHFSSSEVFDDPDNAKGTPKAQYFFGDVKALAAFIDKMTVGMEGSLVEDTANTILANCPEQYGAIYRNYKATGEMLDLNGSETEI